MGLIGHCTVLSCLDRVCKNFPLFLVRIQTSDFQLSSKNGGYVAMQVHSRLTIAKIEEK